MAGASEGARMEELSEYAIFKAVEQSVLIEIRKGQHGFREDLEDATEEIRAGYTQASLDDGTAMDLPFANSAYRWAYAFRYSTSHTYVVLKALNRLWEISQTALNPWLDSLRGQQLRVCCVGGGPGTDLIGIALFIQQHRLDINKIHADVLDRWPEWKTTFRALSGQLKIPQLGKVNYRRFDFNETSSWQQLQNIRNADLVTMVKFASTVAADLTTFQVQLTAVIAQMKDGAMLLAIDNGNSTLFDLICQAAADVGLHVLGEMHYTNKLPQREKTAIDSSPLQLGGLKSQKTSAVSAFLWQKQISLETINRGKSTATAHSNSASDSISIQSKMKTSNSLPHLNVSCSGINLASRSCHDHQKSMPKYSLPQTIAPASTSNAMHAKQTKESLDVSTQTVPLEVLLAQVLELWATSRDDQSITDNFKLTTSTSPPLQAAPASKQFETPGRKEPAEEHVPTKISMQSGILLNFLSGHVDIQEVKNDNFHVHNKPEELSFPTSDVTSPDEPEKKISKTTTALLQAASVNPAKVPLNLQHVQGENIKKAKPIAMKNDDCGATFNSQSHQSHLLSNVFPAHNQTIPAANDFALHSKVSTTTVPAITDTIPADTTSPNSMEWFKGVDHRTTLVTSSFLLGLGVSFLAIIIYRRYCNS